MYPNLLKKNEINLGNGMNQTGMNGKWEWVGYKDNLYNKSHSRRGSMKKDDYSINNKLHSKSVHFGVHEHVRYLGVQV